MNPFLKVMKLFLMMTGTVLGMLLLLLVTPDLEDSMLRAVERYHRNYRVPDPVQPPPLSDTVIESRFLYSNMTRTSTVDVQGFMVNGSKFVFKEVAVLDCMSPPQKNIGRSTGYCESDHCPVECCESDTSFYQDCKEATASHRLHQPTTNSCPFADTPTQSSPTCLDQRTSAMDHGTVAACGRPMRVELDRSRKSFTPWPYSEDCRRYHVHFARQKSLPMTALVSFPGSGNTWVRYLLETASGVFTGSVYTDRQIIIKGFYGEAVPPDCGCTAVQKTHGFSLAGLVPIGVGQRAAEVKLFRGRGILLVRNPYEALLSYRNFLYGGHTGFAPHNKFIGPEWERFASQLAVVWRDLAATWINYTRGREAMVLHFEMLRLDPRHDLRRVLEYLGIAVDERRLTCVLNHVDGPFRRPQSTQQLLFSSRDPFTNKLHEILDSVIHDLDEMLMKRGWGHMPVHLYKFYSGNYTRMSSINPLKKASGRRYNGRSYEESRLSSDTNGTTEDSSGPAWELTGA
ncbi:uncharacterized protein [Anabrus simplex]|uniref:uncharacterized protein n=1 Tax=Anabrus simplex TaxID=316456 RepID=UPI0035A2E553